MLDAIHNAACHLWAFCPGMDVDAGVDGGANKAAALLLRVKAMRR
jgi:hypothetical protein